MSYIILYLTNFWFQSQEAGVKFRRVRRFLLTSDKGLPLVRCGTRNMCGLVSDISHQYFASVIALVYMTDTLIDYE